MKPRRRSAGPIAVLLLGLAAEAPALAQPAAPERAALLRRLSASVLKVEAQREARGVNLGSAVVIGPETVVTNCHVTRDAVQVVAVRGAARWTASAQAAAPELDLCVLRVPGLHAEPAPLRRELDGLHAGDPLLALGYIAGAGLQMSTGRLYTRHAHAGGEVLQVTAGFTSGASGGGLFDADGRLLGILTFRQRGSALGQYAAPVAWLDPLLDEARYAPVEPLPSEARAYWERADTPAEAQRRGRAERLAAPPRRAGETAPRPRFLRAAVLEGDQRWSELLELTRVWLDDRPQDPEPWALRGHALLALGEVEAGVRALETALRHDPGWPPALETLGWAELKRGRPQAAALLLQRLRAQLPEAGDTLALALQAGACAPGDGAPEPSDPPHEAARPCAALP